MFYEFVKWGHATNYYKSTTQPYCNPAIPLEGVGYFDDPSLFIGKSGYYEFDLAMKTWDWNKASKTLGLGNGPGLGAQYRNRLFQYLLANGYCILSYSVSNAGGNWFSSPGTSADELVTQNFIWPGPDAAFLKRFIDAMYNENIYR